MCICIHIYMYLNVYRSVPSTYCECIKAPLRGRYHMNDFLTHDTRQEEEEQEEQEETEEEEQEDFTKN
jgi:hypothetical protein